MPFGCGFFIPAERDEPVGTCTLLGRLKGGGFAIKASGSNGSRGEIRTLTGGVLDAVPLLVGLRDRCGEMAPVVGLAPTRTGLKDRALGSLHSRAFDEMAEREPSDLGSRETDSPKADPEGG